MKLVIYLYSDYRSVTQDLDREYQKNTCFLEYQTAGTAGTAGFTTVNAYKKFIVEKVAG